MDTTVRHSAISVKQATIGTVFLENLTQVILLYIYESGWWPESWIFLKTSRKF